MILWLLLKMVKGQKSLASHLLEQTSLYVQPVLSQQDTSCLLSLPFCSLPARLLISHSWDLYRLCSRKSEKVGTCSSSTHSVAEEVEIRQAPNNHRTEQQVPPKSSMLKSWWLLSPLSLLTEPTLKWAKSFVVTGSVPVHIDWADILWIFALVLNIWMIYIVIMMYAHIQIDLEYYSPKCTL